MPAFTTRRAAAADTMGGYKMRTSRFVRIAALGSAAVAAALALPAFAQSSADTPAASDDIIVTATKRSESVRDVALPISAVTGDQLAKANANSLSDYITRLPGVVFNDYQPGISEVVIRGISATTYHEQGQTTTGYYLNEVQIVEPGFPIGIPDIDTFDIERVEVLRGPQGTLFGSSTLGGLVNYVARTADTTKFDAAGEGLIGTTYNAHGDVNYAAKAMVNIPIVKDVLAVRVMALQRYDAGYLDNPGTGVLGSNDFRTRGLRGSIVFTPAEGTRITYLGTYQDTKLDDQTYLNIPTYTRDTPRAEPQSTKFFLNSLRVDQDLGFATATVIGSVDDKRNQTFYTDPYGYVTGIVTGPNAAYGPGIARANIKTIEGRLASKDDGGPLRWLVGVSYLRATKYSYDQIIAPGAQAIIGSTLAPNDRIYGYISNSLNTDLGIFGEATLTPFKGLEITVGGRYYSTRASATVTNQAGFISGSAVDLTGSVNQKEHGFTPKATVALRPAKNFMAYFTYSRGYRVGGINPNAGLLPAIPTAYGSDQVNNYEAGVKTQLFDRRLLLDASVFTVNWNNIQAREFGPGPSYFSYVINAASANVTGVEFSGTVKLTKALSFSSNVTYQNAELTAFLVDNYGPGYPSGTPLPGSSKWSVANNLSLDLAKVYGKPSFEIAHRYLSSAPVALGSTFTRGNFNIFDLRAAINVIPQVRVMVFADNVFNKYGILNAPFASSAVPLGSIVRPRTIGLRFDFGL